MLKAVAVGLLPVVQIPCGALLPGQLDDESLILPNGENGASRTPADISNRYGKFPVTLPGGDAARR